MQSVLRAGCLAIIALFAVSCTVTPLKIVQTFWQLNLVRNPTTRVSHESLSLFVHVSDSDGIADLDSIYLVNDQRELYWHLDSSNWQYRDENEELWVGSNTIEMPDRSPLPRGKYRVLVSNLAGVRITAEIFVSALKLDAARVSFPALAIVGNSIQVASAVPRTTVWLYSPSGRLIGSRRETGGEFSIASLLGGAKASTTPFSLYAYAYEKSCGCGLITGPYSAGDR
jgi:hypothetical protein